MKIIDISKTVSPETEVYPGDTPFTVSWINRGTINTSELKFTPHVGTHIDAPWHFGFRSFSFANAALDIFIGPVIVIEAEVSNHLITMDVVPESILRTKRVLFKTSDPLARLSPPLARVLADEDMILVGISTESVDPENSSFETHKILLSSGIFIVENLELQDVKEGEYLLHCAPLKWCEAEASPVRAYLISDREA